MSPRTRRYVTLAVLFGLLALAAGAAISNALH
jgi:hypothetical protein